MAPTQFEPQPLTAPLNEEAVRSLSELQHQRDRETKAREHLKKAAQLLTDMTGELNDRAYLRRARHSKEKARRREAANNGTEDGGAGAEENEEDPAVAEADARYEEFQRKVEALTKRMDLSIRGVIDDMAWLAEYPATLKAVVEKAQESMGEPRRDHQTQSLTQRTRQRRRVVDDGDEAAEQNQNEEEEEQEDDNDVDAGPSSRSRHQTSMLPTIHPADTPHISLSTALTQQARTWTSKTLTERYARNNDYRGWYRVLYDAKNPGESAPPMPNESLWFAAEEGRINSLSSSQRRHHPQGSNADETSMTEEEEDEDEVEIAAEKTRLKCPITLLPYIDPVTSKNCNHSYERAAILSMLSTSTDFAPFTQDQLAELSQLGNNQKQRARREREIRIKQVKCPECNTPLIEADLVDNPALKRRVARLLAQERRDNLATSDVDGESHSDDDDDDGDGHNVRGTQRRPAALGSSSPPPLPSSVRKSAKQIKAERMSGVRRAGDEADVDVVPQTQLAEDDRRAGRARGRGRGTRRVMDLDDDEEED
ncbi:uncharacterized protein Z520_07781 [Fonsecaea multimorphosa CBS 102226]|uniref:peptidylprolyl isomerase n=1 Tax=Fonsecaea multimorphosa CBS 102226 TaxID=1442371 RepID=A0A0D2H3V1_9EURO|nr:uncharacterized protein Z520_07781 [Fonsecaea multimorphosa CBS 102226]KIX96515.1 hypothetical protein Z520_07781 [Fonsecaea multimorphosa CBS 102226]OAL28043.1 hypothetical protein AYO22_03070 [Fonsecaea multimorphosa]